MALEQLITKKLELESKWASQALAQKRVTPEMKWLDIEIKDIKIKLNDQSVKDAEAELITQANDITT